MPSLFIEKDVQGREYDDIFCTTIYDNISTTTEQTNKFEIYDNDYFIN